MEFASKGVAGTALGLSIGSLGAQALTGGLGNLFGGLTGNCTRNSEDTCVNRYELGLIQEIIALKTGNELRDANAFTMSELNKLRDYTDRRVERVEGAIAQQAVHNATSDSMLGCMAQQIAALQGLTKIIVPADNVCPSPMPQYNSWTAPTATTTTG
jgi:hypothetical protein